MATNTYTSLQSVRLASPVASLQFGSIPNTYKDLRLVIRVGFSDDNVYVRFNGDTGTNYKNLTWNGSGTVGTNFGTHNLIYTGESAATYFAITIDILDYAATDKHKHVLITSWNNHEFVVRRATRWENTGALNTILCYNFDEAFQAGSSFALFGIG